MTTEHFPSGENDLAQEFYFWYDANKEFSLSDRSTDVSGVRMEDEVISTEGTEEILDNIILGEN